MDAQAKNNASWYQAYNRRRETLALLTQRVSNVLHQLELHEDLALSQQLHQIVLHWTFKVLVLGQYKTGKSTLINALLKADVVPASVVPTTATITEIKWDESGRAVVHFVDENVPPKEIPISELEQYLVIGEKEEEVQHSKVEVFWPSEVCRHQVEIIDTPGLNENQVLEELVINYSRVADVILFVVSALFLGTSHEKLVIDNLRDAGYTEIFFVFNRIDAVMGTRDLQRVKQRAREKFAPLTALDNGLHFISSRDALDGALENDPDLVKRSGIDELEAALAQHLVTVHGRIKLLRAAYELRRLIQKAQGVVAEHERVIQVASTQLHEQYEHPRSQLKGIENDVHQIMGQINRFRTDTHELVRARVRELYYSLADKVDIWLDAYQLKLDGLSLVAGRQRFEQTVFHLLEYLEQSLKQEAEQWQTTMLSPFLHDRFTDLVRELDWRLEQFHVELNRIRYGFPPQSSRVIWGIFAQPDDHSSSLDQVLTAGVGEFTSNTVAVELTKRIVDGLKVTHAIRLIVGLSPATVLVQLFSSLSWISGNSNKIKSAIGDDIRVRLREASTENSESAARVVDDMISKFEQQIDRGLQLQIQEVRELVEIIPRPKERMQEALDQKFHPFLAIRRELLAITSELDAFTDPLAEHSRT
jgi:small GTP-binding protein